MANPNPKRRWTREDQRKGNEASVIARKQQAMERMTFHQSFLRACQDERGEDAEAVRIRLTAKLIEIALSGKQWALDLALGYLYGKPKQAIEMDVTETVAPPSSLPELPDDLRDELRRLRDRMHELRGEVVSRNGH